MARKPSKPRRQFARTFYIKGQVDETLTLGTLAAKTLISVTFDEVTSEQMRCSSVQAIWSLGTYTPTLNAGPILIGIAHSDYTDAEIEAVIESTGSWDRGDKISQEIGKRLVRRIGVFDTPDDANDEVVLNDGKPIKTKLNWHLNTGKTLRLWAYNQGTAALATTNPAVRAQGHANLWQKT